MGQFLPAVGEELVDAGVGVRGNTLEEVAQVGKGIDAMPFGALDKTVEGGGGGTPTAAAGEKPVVASDNEVRMARSARLLSMARRPSSR